ncbi:MAG: ATP-binding protein [Pseudomonadota bacterium]
MIRVRPPTVRVLLLLFAALAVVQLILSASAFFRLNADRDGDFSLPLPTRVTAIVAMVETTPPERIDILLKALSDSDFEVWLVDTPEVPLRGEHLDLSQVARAVDAYVDALGDRDVAAWIAPEPGKPVRTPRLESLRLWSPHPMRLAVSLQDDRWLMIETREPLPQQVFGLPPGIVAGFVGVLVAFLSLITLWQGLGPLESLSRSLSAFAIEPKPQTLLLRGPRETRDVTAAVNRMQTVIADLLRDRQVMFAGMSHDLRTYLTRLRLRIEGIEDERARVKAEADLEQMAEIVEDGLALAQLETVASITETVDLAELVEGLAADELTVVSLVFEPEDGRFEIEADPYRMRRAILNLLINAERHGAEPEVHLRKTNTGIELDIADRGPGISVAEKTRLLRPFERGDKARTTDKPGSGLGLAIAKRIAEQHGGDLCLIDRPGGGLIARITLPLRPKG